MEPLAGKTALVTGASRGIGRAIAQRLAKDGALVAVHYGSSEQAALEVTEAITRAGGRAFALRAPLGEPGDAQALWASFDAAAAGHGAAPGVDIIVNNAGVPVYGAIGGVGGAEFDRAFAVNVRAPFFIVQEGLGRLRDGGRIINISSGAARIATTPMIAYAMTKGAVNALSRTLALELGPRGITVNSVEPGIVSTDMTPWLADEQLSAQAASWAALSRLGDPSDIADVVAFLASPDARWVTGQHIDATGGLLLGPVVTAPVPA
jgi:3-oxoacyl-[acyl-carrier protein] reductase